METDRSAKLEGRYEPPEPNDNAVREPGLESPYFH